jgi:hypothetical protein
MDLAQRHPELIFQPPETGEQDGAREEVVLAILPLEHDRQVVLHHTGSHLHRVFSQRPRYDVE